MVAASWKPDRFFSLGGFLELWPTRDHVVNEGTVHVGAWAFGVASCLEALSVRAFSMGACVRAAALLYMLSAEGFVNSETSTKATFAMGGDVRLRVAVRGPFGLFALGGFSVPFSHLEVAVRGATTGFDAASVAPIAGLGVEVNP